MKKIYLNCVKGKGGLVYGRAAFPLGEGGGGKKNSN